MPTAGTNRLVRIAAVKGAKAAQRQGATAAERRRKTKLAKRPNLIQYAHASRPNIWTSAELALLGTIPDDEVAEQLGRMVNAVRLRREKLGLRNPCDRQRTKG